MKKTLILLLTALFLVTPFYAATEGETESETDWKEQGKKALEETGKFFKKAGEKTKEKIEEASTITCYGIWNYESENCNTTFICSEDGSMNFTKKVGMDTDYWIGTFNATFKIITFKITEAGRKGAFMDKKSSNPEQIWRFTYSVSDDGKSMKIYSNDIPSDIDGTDFSKGVTLKKIK